jgi:hypothetical protein
VAHYAGHLGIYRDIDIQLLDIDTVLVKVDSGPGDSVQAAIGKTMDRHRCMSGWRCGVEHPLRSSRGTSLSRIEVVDLQEKFGISWR